MRISPICCAAIIAAASTLIPLISPSAVRRALRAQAAHSLQANIRTPAAVDALLSRACNDCHSLNTKWPWYSNFAPVAWLIEYDITRARKAVNFSEWAVQAGRRKGLAMGTLAAMCEGVKTGQMPPVQYKMLHPEAEISEAESKSLCAWTHEAMVELRNRPNTSARIVSSRRITNTAGPAAY